MTNYKSIAQWAEDDRPREKLLQHGKQTLSNAELLAILLGSGSAVDLAKQILAHYDNNLSLLARASAQELCKNFKGVGTAKAVTILATMELAVRKGNNTAETPQVKNSEDAFKIFAPYLSNLAHEEFWIALLDNSNKLIATKKLSMGGTKGTTIDKKILLKLAVEHLASGLIIAHNHPSGMPKPSQEDRNITQAIKELCQLLDIQLIDHIIICNKDYFVSFADEGIL